MLCETTRSKSNYAKRFSTQCINSYRHKVSLLSHNPQAQTIFIKVIHNIQKLVVETDDFI